MGLGGPREADIVADYSGRSDWKRFWICDVELGELDLALPNFPQEILEHLNRELFSGATAIAETEWGGLLGELLADHGKCRPLAVIHAYQEMGDDDVLDIDRMELGKELLAEARDRRLYVRRSERSLGGCFQPGIVEILSVGGDAPAYQKCSAIHAALHFSGFRVSDDPNVTILASMFQQSECRPSTLPSY